MKLLAGDIGGTKTALAVYETNSGPTTPLVETTFPSADYPSLEAIVQKFFADQKLSSAEITTATFGVAGPVVDGQATVTNLPWRINAAKIAQTLDLPPVSLINDLVSVAMAIPALPESDLHVLNAGTTTEQGPIAVVAPGTGLGEAYLIHNGRHYQAFPSEGGHADFGPNSETEVELLRYLQQKFAQNGKPAHISWERVCSGVGIPNIYAYFKSTGMADEDPEVMAQIAQGGDVAPIVFNAAQRDNPCPLCEGTLNTFMAILGSEAGNMALKFLSTGGLYLGGGIPPRILSALQKPIFMDAFLNKGRLSSILKDIPVRMILNPKAALLGAASHGFLQLADG